MTSRWRSDLQAFLLGHLSGRIRDEGVGRKSGAAGCSEEFLVFFLGEVQPEKCGVAIKGGMIDLFSLLGIVPTLSRPQVAYEGIITGL